MAGQRQRQAAGLRLMGQPGDLRGDALDQIALPLASSIAPLSSRA
jgi:hypothetical protein